MTVKRWQDKWYITGVPKDLNLIHIETPLGIVNIRLNLHDRSSRRVEVIELVGSKRVGEKIVKSTNRKLVELKKEYK